MTRQVLAENLFGLMPMLNRKLLKRLPQTSFPKSQIRLLHILSHHDGEPMKFFGEKMHISKSNLTKLVEAVCDEGFAERVHDEKDRRIVRLRLTDEGREEMRREFDSITKEIAKMLDVFNDDEVDTLIHHLHEIHELMKKLD